MRIRSAEEYADFVLPSIRTGDRLLDVGCGTGSITVGLARVASHVTGVDLADADEGFEDARAYAAEHGIDNVEFREGSIYELGFPRRLLRRLHAPLDAGDPGRSARRSR